MIEKKGTRDKGQGTSKKAQSTIEFTFAIIVICFLTYGLIRVFRWAGMDLAERRFAHEQSMANGATAEQQLTPDFYRAKRLNTVFKGGQ